MIHKKITKRNKGENKKTIKKIVKEKHLIANKNTRWLSSKKKGKWEPVSISNKQIEVKKTKRKA